MGEGVSTDLATGTTLWKLDDFCNPISPFWVSFAARKGPVMFVIFSFFYNMYKEKLHLLFLARKHRFVAFINAQYGVFSCKTYPRFHCTTRQRPPMSNNISGVRLVGMLL